MSLHNSNNRPSAQDHLGTLDASGVRTLMFADKNILIRSVTLVGLPRISGDGTNHFTFQMQMSQEDGTLVDVGGVVSTNGANSKTLELFSHEGYELPKGRLLAVNITEVGSSAIANAHVSVDYEVKGN